MMKHCSAANVQRLRCVRRDAGFGLLGLSFLVAPAALAAEHGEDPDEIVVWGRAIDLIGEVKSASEGIVGYADFETRPLSRAGELVEVIPGIVATQHSGAGKANQYFLRGFNLDHGTDFSASVDGVPVNLRSHGHGQGYLDLNFVIPEVVERVEYRKGAYFADGGDFSSAGSARIVTYDRLDENFAEITVGEYGYIRGVGGLSANWGGTSFLVAAEGLVSNGPWILDEDLQKVNGVAKLSHEAGNAFYRFAVSAYDASWNSTDQIPLRAVESGLIDRFGFVDSDLGGETRRIAATGAAEWTHGNGKTALSAYAVSYGFHLWSNFTYFLDDSANGDEFEQRDKRWVYGGALSHERPLGAGGLQLRVGAEFRLDDVADVGLFRTAARARLSTVRQDSLEEFSAAAFAELEVPLTPSIRATFGARGDYYSADVDAVSLPVNSGEADQALFSPSLALVWTASDRLEFYANYGRGFHSNDARGAVISIDPASGLAAVPVNLLARSDGAEIGARFESGSFNASLAGFWLDLDSELVYVGDAGGTEPNDATRRFGVEASAFWSPAPWLALDASAAYTDAAFKAVAPGADRISGAVETVVSAGAVATFDPLTVDIHLRHFGSAPLIEDNSVRSSATTLVNIGATYDIGRVRLGLDIFNLFDSKDADISYFYESQLPGETAPVEDIHFHPVEPRQVRGSVSVHF